MLNGLVGAKFAGSHASVAGISDVIERKQPIGLTDQNLLSRLPEHLLTRLFGGAATVQFKTDEVLFLSAKPAMGATVSRMRLLRVAMVSRAGRERTLVFFGHGAIVGEMSIVDGLPRFQCGGSSPLSLELS